MKKNEPAMNFYFKGDLTYCSFYIKSRGTPFGRNKEVFDFGFTNYLN